MIECPQCGAFTNRHQGWCARCAAELENNAPQGRADRFHRESPTGFVESHSSPGHLDTEIETGALVRIARFQSAAEAGYFADALRRVEQIPAEVTVDEEREATHGSWSVRFALLVPASCAELAALALRRLIDESSDDVAELETESGAETELPLEPVLVSSSTGSSPHVRDEVFQESVESAGVNWVPIVITLAVGSAAFVTARKWVEAPRAHPIGAPIGAREEALWDALRDNPTPWRQAHPNGRGVRELVISPQGDRALLREDVNGDGRFDREDVWSLEP